MIYERTITATWEPVSIEDAREHCRLVATNNSHTDDSYLEILIAVARETLEHDTKRCIVTSTFNGYLDTWPKNQIILQQSPVTGVSAVKYLSSGSYATWSATEYETDTVSKPARIRPKDGYSWPDIDTAINAVKVEFTAGYSSAEDVPEIIKHAMKMLIYHWYINRSQVATGTQVNDLPQAYEKLMDIAEIKYF